MNAEQAKQKNIVNMSSGFGAMTRLFEEGSHTRIVGELQDRLPKIASSKDAKDFRRQHDSFSCWFKSNIKTAERKKKNGVIIKESGPASYGQGAKVLDVALKVYVYYCQMPEPKTANKLIKWLNAAIDTEMMKYLKKPGSIEDVDKKAYDDLQKLVRKDIKDNFQNSILPVQWDDIKWRELNNKDEIYSNH